MIVKELIETKPQEIKTYRVLGTDYDRNELELPKIENYLPVYDWDYDINNGTIYINNFHYFNNREQTIKMAKILGDDKGKKENFFFCNSKHVLTFLKKDYYGIFLITGHLAYQENKFYFYEDFTPKEIKADTLGNLISGDDLVKITFNYHEITSIFIINSDD